MSVDPFFVLTPRYFVVSLLIFTSVHKLRDVAAVRSAIVAHCPPLAPFASAVAYLLMALEVGIGCAMANSFAGRVASFFAVGLLACYLLVLAASWVRGNRLVSCGCSFHEDNGSLTGVQIARNGALVLLAVAACWPESTRTIGWLDSVQVVLATTALTLIYLSADALIAQQVRGDQRGVAR